MRQLFCVYKITRRFALSVFVLFSFLQTAFTQADSFDVFAYQPPPFFTKSDLPSRLQFSMINKDGSFCTITLHKSGPAKEDSIQNVMSQWNKLVVKILAKAQRKPARIMTGQTVDGWMSALAIGSFYHNKKKSVVMLYSFKKDQSTACAVFAFSDKLFKGPVESFSQNLHLISQ